MNGEVEAAFATLVATANGAGIDAREWSVMCTEDGDVHLAAMRPGVWDRIGVFSDEGYLGRDDREVVTALKAIHHAARNTARLDTWTVYGAMRSALRREQTARAREHAVALAVSARRLAMAVAAREEVR